MKGQLAITCQLSRLARRHLNAGVDREGIVIAVETAVLTKRIDKMLKTWVYNTPMFTIHLLTSHI